MSCETTPDLVSVLVPLYNRERTIGAALESVLAQTYQNFEVVIVDDGSSDGSAEVAAQYSHGDERFLVLRHAANRGAAAALNTAIGAAQRQEYQPNSRAEWDNVVSYSKSGFGGDHLIKGGVQFARQTTTERVTRSGRFSVTVAVMPVPLLLM